MSSLPGAAWDEETLAGRAADAALGDHVAQPTGFRERGYGKEFGKGISKGRAARVPPFPLAARLPSVKGNPLPCPPTNRDGGSRIRISVPLSDKTRGSPETCACCLQTLTPPGSPASIAIGTGLSDMQPGCVQGLQLVVADIDAARAELVDRGVEVSEVQQFDWGSFVFFSDPDGNGWAVQRLPARGE
jgi:hypothetical protein